MRISWKWLKELVAVDMMPEEGAALLTGAGLEVEKIEHLNKGVENVVTGKVLSVEAHPNAAKLVTTRVDAGQGKPLTVVTGAPNVKPDMCVAVALVGAKLPSAQHPEIVLTELRGVLSEGMMCGADELGLDLGKLTPEEKEGLYPLPPDTVPGQPIVEFLGLDDTVLEIGLTPNRSDCMGMINIAREMAALSGAPLTLPRTGESLPGGECGRLATGEIEEGDALCYRFGARLVKDVKVGPSPQWMRQRLMAMGMRSINNVVDISNIVMLEMNRPLHFFDFDRLSGGGLWIRRARPGERIVTLDGQDRALDGEMTLVTDREGPVAVAGVMGGLRTEVTEKTVSIMIEAACWNGAKTRRTGQALGLHSEAGQRFEREVDIEATVGALDRAVELIEACGAGTGVDGHLDIWPCPAGSPEVRVSLSRVNAVLGIETTAAALRGVWERLRIRVKSDGGESWLLEAPSWRKDLRIEEDYIEEAARLFGYDKIPATLPEGPVTRGYRLPGHRLRREMARVMVGQGYREVVNYSFINPASLDRTGVPEGHPWRRAVTILNPLSEEQKIMRTNVLPSMLRCAAENIRRQNHELLLFELGKVYCAAPGNSAGVSAEAPPEERWTLAALCAGTSPKQWLSPEEELGFYTMKGSIEGLLSALGVSGCRFAAAADIPGLHPGRAARVFCGDRELGWLGEADPRVAEAFGAELRLAVSSLDVAAVLDCVQKRNYHAPGRYPEIIWDLAVALPREIPAAAVEEKIRTWGGALLREVRLFDHYEGTQLEEGQKSLAFALTWGSDERTLKDEEIQILRDGIEKRLAEGFGALVRGR